MARHFRVAFLLAIALSFGFLPLCLRAQGPKSASPPATSAVTPEKALALAQQGHCKEAMRGLKSALAGTGSPDLKKNAGVAGLRCALGMDDRSAASDFIRLLSKQFPNDPDVLFVVVHAYSDLSTRAAQDLGRIAPQSVAAHKLNAEALEMQGKWDGAQLEYETILEKQPNAIGIHYLLGRLYLSRPDADAKAFERAKEEFTKELELDPKNAGAHYILGQLASKNEDWETAIKQFSTAATLDPNFAEAYLGWGFSLVTVKRYQEAIDPLRVAERLIPENPAVHYTLGNALGRSGHREEAEKEFAIQRSLLEAKTPTEKPEQPH